MANFGFFPYLKTLWPPLSLFHFLLFDVVFNAPTHKSIVAFASFAMSLAENMVKYAFSISLVKSGRNNALLGC